ncbi:MAG: hypothetical protein PUB57_04880 [Selenomonadaceae bacterium]|jgi:hypothetical protein|nr:hypothetical protein [Selenomonadaceae bacterium]
MKKYDFYYAICNQYNPGIFAEQCAAIEKWVPGIKKGKLLEDADGSCWQTYTHEKGEVEVENSYYENEVNVRSDFDLLPYFGGCGDDV